MKRKFILELEFHKSFASAVLLHAVALGSLYLIAAQPPAEPKERAITVSFAAAPKPEYFTASPKSKPEILPKETPEVPQEVASATETATSAPPIQTVAPAIGKKIPLTYLERLQVSVQAASHLPETAIKNKVSGNAVLRLSFTRKGTILNYSLAQRSGNTLIDSAAMATGRKLLQEKFPPAPKNFDTDQQVLTYDFPVSFNPQESI